MAVDRDKRFIDFGDELSLMTVYFVDADDPAVGFWKIWPGVP
jgi:hypothetical protein